MVESNLVLRFLVVEENKAELTMKVRVFCCSVVAAKGDRSRCGVILKESELDIVESPTLLQLFKFERLAARKFVQFVEALQ